MVRFIRVAAVCLAVVALCLPLQAEPLISDGAFPDIDDLIRRQEKQFYAINAYPFGLSLDAAPASMENQALAGEFVAGDETDLKAATGLHPFELLQSYGVFGDLGMFGGVAAVGTAFHYMTLKKEGAPETELALARKRLVRAIESWHIFMVVTGGNGVVARGIRRLVPEDPNDPPIPGGVPELIPLADENGNPLPEPKDNGTWRDDNSGGALPPGVWIWEDSHSKDQMDGYVFALAAMYDAAKGDPDIDQALVAQMEQDAVDIATMLMEKRTITMITGGEAEYDLIIMDADGRPTYHHDLNPYSLEKAYFPEGEKIFNTFNLIMTLGILKGLHHVSGMPELEQFLYQELMVDRNFLDMVPLTEADGAVDYIYAKKLTFHSNVNMIATALYLAIYYETDPDVIEVLQAFARDRWWNREDDFSTAKKLKNPFYDAIYLAIAPDATEDALVDEAMGYLGGFPLGPYLNSQVINCDADEGAAGECLAIDGETVLTLDNPPAEAGEWATKEALSPPIRPPSNYISRSNPFETNGGGGMRLNPGGDMLAAYWMMRFLERRDESLPNRSPHAREHIPVVVSDPEPDPELVPEAALEPAPEAAPEPAPDVTVEIVPAQEILSDWPAGDVAVAADTTSSSGGKSGGCSAGVNPERSGWAPILLLLLVVAVAVVRREGQTA